MSHPLRVLLCSVLISLLILASTPFMYAAQLADDTAFVGTVTDLVTGNPLSGVHISAGDVTVETDVAGNYVLTLPAGNYALYASLPGYIGMTQLYRQLESGRARVDFEMVVSDPTEEQQEAIEEKMFSSDNIATLEGIEQELETASITTQAVYESPQTILVQMEDGTIVEMEMEEYLRGVVCAEMPAYWPIEALKAQAVASRSYAANHSIVGTTTSYQVWRATTYDSGDRAVSETGNIVARYDGKVIWAFFSACCGGHTQDNEDVWTSGNAIPYLRGVQCVCQTLDPAPSANGHGVGMCQWGAYTLAQWGYSFDEIIKYYYTGVELYIPVPSDIPSVTVSPSSGDKGTVFSFQASYNQVLSGAPAVAIVLFQQNGGTRAQAMQRVGDSTDPYTYLLETNLPAGTQAYQFYFDDGDGNVARWPEDGSFATIAVSDSGTASLDTGVLVEDIIHSSNFMWGYGTGSNVTNYTSGDTDGGLTLSFGYTLGEFYSQVSEVSGGFQGLYANWYGLVPSGASLVFWVKTRDSEGTWSDWVELEQADDAPDSRSIWSDPIFGQSTAVQYRVRLIANGTGDSPILEYVRLLCLDASEGPTASSLVGQGDQTQYQLVSVLSRETWGADASLSSTSDEAEPEGFVLHDTTSLNGLDPAAALRCMEYVQSAELNMGGLACNYAIDSLGNVYEARDGGAGVAGTHLDEGNESTIGVLLLGDYASSTPSSAMIDSLEDLVAQDSVEYELDPTGQFSYSGSTYPVVSAHSGWENVSCPGSQVLSILSTIRSTALSRFSLISPRITIEGLVNGGYVSAVQQAILSSNVPISSAVLRVDGVQVDQDTISPYILRWNTTEYADGKHTVVISASNDGGSAQQSLTLNVDNTAPTGTVTAPTWTNSLYTYFEVVSSGANYVQFSNDWLWEAEDLSHEAGTGSVVTDALALNGKAWSAVDASRGYWYGPYTFDLPSYRTYEAYFRLRAIPDEGNEKLATLDASDSNGLRIYSERDIASADFASENYVDVPIAFDYLSSFVPEDGATAGGLEFRALYYGSDTLAMDRVTIYSEKLPVGSSVGWALEAVEGQQTILVRLSDKADNAVESTLTVGLDLTEPTWVNKGTTSATVRDTLSGLDPSTAMWCNSRDGGKTWSSWSALSLTVEEGTKDAVTLQAPTGTSGIVRFRIADLAGNMADTMYVTYLPLSYRQSE